MIEQCGAMRAGSDTGGAVKVYRCDREKGHQGAHHDRIADVRWTHASESDNRTASELAADARRKQGSPGIGGAPTRCTTLPEDATERKKYPVASGFMDYFPDAIVAIAHLSWQGNEQHNPGQPLHWARGKSADEADTMLRHFLARGTRDTDGVRHTVKMAWRALALLQKELEQEG